MKDLSLHILDIVQNSIRAKARLISIEVEELPDQDLLQICIADDGTGMTPEEQQKPIDPFYTSRSTRKVGLGLSLFKQNAEQTGGDLQIESAPGKGTRVNAVFGLTHIDRPIMGDLAGTLIILFCSPGQADYVFKHKTPSGEFILDTREVRQMLGDVPLDHQEVRVFLKDMINENLEQIHIRE